METPNKTKQNETIPNTMKVADQPAAGLKNGENEKEKNEGMSGNVIL